MPQNNRKQKTFNSTNIQHDATAAQSHRTEHETLKTIVAGH